LDAALAQAICDSPVGGTRALLYTLRRVEAQNMNEWKCFLFTLGGLWGLKFLLYNNRSFFYIIIELILKEY